MNRFKKTSIVFVLTFILLLGSSCSLIRKKEQSPPVDRTEKSLTIYNINDSSDVFQALIQNYLVKNPYTRITYKSFDDFEEYEKLILNELAEGGGPDIFAMPNSWFVKNRKKLISMPANQGDPSIFRSVFVDVAAKDLVIPDNDGIEQVYGVPLYVDTVGIYYNKRQFEDAVPSSGKPSSTWEGLKNDVYLLTKGGETSNDFDLSGVAMGVTSNVKYAVDVLFALMLQNGTKFYDEKMSDAIFASFSIGSLRPANEALNFYMSFADRNQKHYSWNKYASAGLPNGDISAFAAGKVSMIFGYASTYDEILSEIKTLSSSEVRPIDRNAIGTAMFPQLADPSVSTDKRVTFADYVALGVSRTSKYSNEAWDFLTFLASPDSQKHYFDKTHKPSGLRGLISEQSADPIYGVFARQAGFAESFPVTDYLWFRDNFSLLIDDAWAGGSPGSLLNSLQTKLKGFLPSSGYLVPLSTASSSESKK